MGDEYRYHTYAQQTVVSGGKVYEANSTKVPSNDGEAVSITASASHLLPHLMQAKIPTYICCSNSKPDVAGVASALIPLEG